MIYIYMYMYGVMRAHTIRDLGIEGVKASVKFQEIMMQCISCSYLVMIYREVGNWRRLSCL